MRGLISCHGFGFLIQRRLEAFVWNNRKFSEIIYATVYCPNLYPLMVAVLYVTRIEVFVAIYLQWRFIHYQRNSMKLDAVVVEVNMNRVIVFWNFEYLNIRIAWILPSLMFEFFLFFTKPASSLSSNILYMLSKTLFSLLAHRHEFLNFRQPSPLSASLEP